MAGLWLSDKGQAWGAFAQAGAQAQPEVRTLAPGQPTERELKGGESHSYQITLSAKQFLHVVASQRGVDVAVALLGPDGQELFEVNGRRDESGDEIIAFVATTGGRYRLVVRAVDKSAAPGSYGVRFATLRTATETDRQRAAAEQAMREGERLRGEAKPEVQRQALAQFETALAAWRKLGDQAREADTLFALGQVHSALREFQPALDYARQTASLRHAAADQAGEAEALNLSGAAYNNLRKFAEAIAAYQQALPLSRAAGRRRLEANLLSDIGNAYAGQSDFQQMADYLNQAIPLLRELGDHRDEARQLRRLVRVYENALRDHARATTAFNQARAAYEQAIAASRAADDRNGVATLLYELGETASDANQDAQAIGYWQQALQLWRELKKPEREAQTLVRVGVASRQTGKIQQARDYYQQALALSHELKDQALEVQVQRNLIVTAFVTGEKRQALLEAQRLLPLVRALKDQTQEARTRDAYKAQEAETLNTIGVIFAELGENQAALAHYQQSLALWRELNQRAKEAGLLQNIGETHDRMGDKQQALDLYNQALGFGDRQVQGKVFTNLATVYASLGETEQALKFYQQALEIWRAGNARIQLADVLHLLGHLHWRTGDLPQARTYLEQALPIWREVQDKRGEANTTGTLGAVYAGLDQQAKAFEYLRQSLPLHRAVGNREGEEHALTDLALLSEKVGERVEALALLNQARPLAEAVSDRIGEAQIHYELARLNLKAGDLNAARTQIEATLRLVEALRARVVSQELRASYLATTYKYYDLYIDLLMRLHERRSGENFDGEALQASERARARSLIELLIEANANIRAGADPALLARERELQQRLNGKAARFFDLEARQAATGAVEIAALKAEMISTTAELEQVRTTIKQTSPRYAALTQPRPLTVKEIQQQVLDDDTLLLEYALGEERSFLWAVAKDSVQSYTLPKRAEIESLARQLYPLLSTNPEKARLLVTKKSAARDNESDGLAQTAARLSRLILGPVAAQLYKANKSRLLIVADGALQYVPFAALPRPHHDGRISKEPLIVKYEMVSLPSASTLAVLRRELQGRPPAPKALAVLADPVFDQSDERVQGATPNTTKPAPQNRDAIPTRILKRLSAKTTPAGSAENDYVVERLPGTRREAENILALTTPGASLKALDFQADRSLAASDELKQYRFVHFATHGYFDSEQPELSALVFSLVNKDGQSQDGFLRSHEIYNLNLPAELVVLSACDSGLGKEVRGEGLVGLTRGFMYAGAARVVVRLRRPDDRRPDDPLLPQNAARGPAPGGGLARGADRNVETETVASAVLLGGVHTARRVAIVVRMASF